MELLKVHYIEGIVHLFTTPPLCEYRSLLTFCTLPYHSGVLWTERDENLMHEKTDVAVASVFKNMKT